MSLEAENAHESYTTQTCFSLTPIDFVTWWKFVLLFYISHSLFDTDWWSCICGPNQEYYD